MRSGIIRWMRSGIVVAGIVGSTACSEPVAPDVQPQVQTGGTQAGIVSPAGPAGAPANQPQPGLPAGNQQGIPLPGMPSQKLVAGPEQLKLAGNLILPKNAPEGAVQIDVNRTAAGGGSAPGPLYTIRLASGGTFEALIPKTVGSITMMIYIGVQNTDPGSVGPENTYAWGPLEVSESSVSDIKIDLNEAPPMTASAASAAGAAGAGGTQGMPPNAGGVAMPLSGTAPGSAPAPGAPPPAGAPATEKAAGKP